MASLSISPQHAPPPYPSPLSSSTSPSKTYSNQFNCPIGICSSDCPQWCILPPPPPLFLNSGDTTTDDSSSSSRISPLMAALIAVLAAAFLLLFYFTVISKLCRNRRRNRRHNTSNPNPNSPFLDSSGPISARVDSLIHDPTRTGLDDAFIRQITVFKYIREDKLIDGTECAVCLNEFNEGENLRLMPNCEHAFHIPCIDTWLKTNSNCPLCRSTMNPVVVPPPPTIAPGSNPSSNNNNNNNNNNISVAALRIERRSNDVVLVVREVDNNNNNTVQVVEPIGEVRNGNLDEREIKLQVNNNNGNNIT